MSRSCESADGMYAFPVILIALLAATVLGPGSLSVLVAVTIGNIPIFMRLTRNQILDPDGTIC